MFHMNSIDLYARACMHVSICELAKHKTLLYQFVTASFKVKMSRHQRVLVIYKTAQNHIIRSLMKGYQLCTS